MEKLSSEEIMEAIQEGVREGILEALKNDYYPLWMNFCKAVEVAVTNCILADKTAKEFQDSLLFQIGLGVESAFEKKEE